MLAESMAVNSVLIHGDLDASTNPLVRVHSSCLTGDVFGSQRCECGPQYLAALDRISQPGQAGMIVYMAGHEGRGIGLWAKAATYLLQDAGEDTYGANESLGLPADCRDFSDASALLHYFIGDRPFRLMTNNPKKLDDLAAMGHNSPDYIATVSEAMKIATVEKDRRIGDPNFVDVPIAELLSDDFADKMADRIRRGDLDANVAKINEAAASGFAQRAAAQGDGVVV